MSERLLKTREAAAILRIAPRTVVRLIEQGDIEGVIVNPSSSQRKHYRIREEEIQKYITEVGITSLE